MIRARRPTHLQRALNAARTCLRLRRDGFAVEFERPFPVPRLHGSTLKPNQNLDLLVTGGGKTAAIELKVPLNRQHPETMYAFCANIEFVKALKRAGMADHGFRLLLTNDMAFWHDSGRGSSIHNAFPSSGVGAAS